MDNIKQLREKIESFITCSDRRCPTLSERYQRHRLKHHSLQKNQPPKQESPSMRSSSSHSYGKVTESLKTNTEEKDFEEFYHVKQEIMDWSKDLPVYHNPKFEDIKQNVVNELIENMNNLLKKKKSMGNLLDSVRHEITEKIYSMPLTYEQQKLFESNLLRRFQLTKESSELKVGKNIIDYNKENLNESRTKLYSNTVRNSYIDIIENMLPVLFTDFKLTTIKDRNDINLQLYKSGSYAGLKPNDFNNGTHKILRLGVSCRSQIYKGIIVRNKTFFEISDYTATIVEYQNILGDSTFDFQNKLSVSDISKQRMSYSKGIRIDAATKSSHRFSGNCISIYRSEDMNIVNSDFLPIPTNNNEFELSVCDLDSFRDTLFNWLLEKQSLLKHKVSLNKKNAAISKMSKTLYGHIKSIKDPQNIIYTDVNKLLNTLLKPKFKDDIKVLSNELIERLYTSLPKTKNTFDNVLVNNETQASTCTNIDTDTLECSLTKLLHKYVEALSEEESILIKEVSSSLFKNKIQSMLVSKFCTKNSRSKDQENNLSYRLKIDIEYIEILTEWLKSTTREINTSNLQENSVILIEIIEIIMNKENDVTGIRKSNEIFKMKISNKLSSLMPSDSKIDTDKLVNELLQKHLKHAQKSICKECYNQNRSDAIDNYFYQHGKDVIKQNLKFNTLLKRILREIKYHCLCNLPHTLVNNEFQYVKEICNWLKNLPLLPVTEEKVRKKIVNTIANFIDEININVEQEEDDSYIRNFIAALPLNNKKEVDIHLALLQLKKRLQRIDKINFENKMDISDKEERIPKLNIVSDIEKWCQKLPTTVSDDETTTILKQRLAWNLLKKFGELNMNSQYYGKGNKRLYENDVTLEIDKQLNESRLNEKIDDTAKSSKVELLNIFIENFEAIENIHQSEKYVLHLRNLIELSLRNNTNINKEEDAVLLNKIIDVSLYLSLLKQFERNDSELTKKCYLCLMEELCAYLQYTKTLFMIPFLYDPNQDLLSCNADHYKNHQFIKKLIKFIKSKSVLSLWIETLPLQKPHGIEEVLHNYDMLTEMTEIVIAIEDKYSYRDTKIDEALMKCIQILPLSASSLERLVVDLKKILLRTDKDRNNNTNATQENDNSILNQTNNSVMLLNSNKSAEHIPNTTKYKDEIQNNSKSLEMKTNHWYSLPPASTTTVDTKNYNTINENYNDKQNVHESQSKLDESSINYKDFEKGVDLKSSVTEPSTSKQTAHTSTHRRTRHEPIVPKYEDFEKGVDFNSSLIESTHMRQRSDTTQTADNKGAKQDNSSMKELIKSSHIAAQTSLRKLSTSPNNIETGLEENKRCDPDCKPKKLSQTSSATAIFSKEEASHKKPEKNLVEQFSENSETYNKEKPQKTYNERCVPNCKPQKSSQTSSLTAIFPKKEATYKKPERNSLERLTETSGTIKQENGKDDTTCNCQRKCLPCYIRRYCNICSSLPLKYHELHFW